ncbi:hypothetical protein AYO21_12104 [Fonsecaea monophora]|uniref:Uncharacterized protein n=1 Tax=Fonsecaea monophora TaxID=254056 RepID=A0A177EP95_9EURO|nr:hypothetical protein AYO21_12104 [Fonsecaea monophora]OAG33804.1 hypothetical protein AYO21_12104 [Fonsecaea monophora]
MYYITGVELRQRAYEEDEYKKAEEYIRRQLGQRCSRLHWRTMDLHAPHTAAALADTPHRRHYAYDRLFTAATAGQRNPIITLPGLEDMRRRCGLPPRAALEDEVAFGGADDDTDHTNDDDPNDLEDGEIREEEGESGGTAMDPRGPTDATTQDAPVESFSEGSETTVADDSMYGDKDGAAEDNTDDKEAKEISDSPTTPHSELVDRGRPLVALPEDLDTDTDTAAARAGNEETAAGEG